MGRIRAVAAVVVVVGVLGLAGCGASKNDHASSGAAKQDSGEAKAQPQAVANSAGQGKSAGQSGQNSQGGDDPTITRAIIKTGSLTVEGDDVSAMRQKAVTAIAGLDGQVASEDTGSD